MADKVSWTGELSGRTISGFPYKRPLYGGSFSRGGGGGGDDDGNGGSGGTGGGTPPAPAFQWTFPQYSQTWAFTPPTPTPYMSPPRFDPKSSTGYAGMSSSSKDSKSGRGDWSNRSSKSSSMSLMDLWRKYGLT